MAQEHRDETQVADRCSQIELTDDDLKHVTGGTDGPPGVGEHNGAVDLDSKATPIIF